MTENKNNSLPRKSFQEILETLARAFVNIGFEQTRAETCARLFTETTRDGVYSHGLNRFPRFMKTIRNGSVDIHAEPELVKSAGALERWDGKSGVGNLNALQSMNRAIHLARENGIGCVALANTNHWMRGGTYGWQAAEAGVIGFCWTNTLPNLLAWGAKEPRLGNNPLVIAVPRQGGHVVIDMALSQFSYGAIEMHRKRGEQLPVDGGFDAEGNITRDPATIEETRRILPMGYWKGSGLSLILDMIAASLAGGLATHQIALDTERDTGVSQTFIAINLPAVDENSYASNLADRIIENLQMPPEDEQNVHYPGEKTLKIRKENMKKGIPVEPEIWNQICALL